MPPTAKPRPPGIVVLAVFFTLGCAISLVSALALAFPGGFLEPMWRLNPRARSALGGMGAWAVVLMLSVSVACGAASVGLWRRRRWGHVLALSLVAINLAGDVVNVLLGTEPRAAVGIPIAGALLAYLASRSVRDHFRPVHSA